MTSAPHLRITNHDYEWSPKYFAVIVGIFCSLYAITNAINFKMIDVYGLILPAGIITFPLCCIITDILTEVYGFNRTRQAIWTVLAVTILFAVLSSIAVHLPPAGFWPHQEAYALVFSLNWRFAIAGCCAWLVGEFVNSFIMSRMKIFQNARWMGARFIGSTVVGQFFDTIVFMTIAFVGTMGVGAFVWLLLSAWMVKVAYEIVALPVSMPSAWAIKRLEGIEHFDRQKISVV